VRKSVTIALFDQAVLSLFNLGINLALIKFAAPVEFGRFIYALTLILVMTSLQNALVQTPISVMLPGRRAAERRDGLKTVVSFDLLLRMGCAVTAGALCLLTQWTPAFLLAVVVAVFTTLARETARNIYIASERVRYCLALDATTVVVAAATIAAGWSLYAPAVVCLVGYSVGNLAALALVARGLIPERLRPLQVIPAYRKFWQKTKWSLVGAATTEVQYRNYVFAIESFRGTSALASVQAGRLLLGPLALIVQSWARVARPVMAKSLARNDYRSAFTTFLTGLLLIVAVGVAYCAALYLAWPWLKALIFAGKYPEVALMTAVWAIYALINVTNIGLSSVLLAANELRDLALVSVGTAILTCLLLLGLAFDVHPVYAVEVLIAGEAVAFVWLIVLVTRLFAGAGFLPGRLSMGTSDGARR
jgi:O-antigen/teichoic acid export membrane protein